jgi:hypothetical protein
LKYHLRLSPISRGFCLLSIGVCVSRTNYIPTRIALLRKVRRFVSVARWALWLAISCLAASRANAQLQVAMDLSSGVATPGSSVALAVSMAASGGAQPTSLQWTMSYSAADVTSVAVVADPAVTAAKSLSCSSSSGSTTCLLFGLNATTIPNGSIASAIFTISAGALSSSVPVTMSGTVASDALGNSIPISSSGGTVTIIRSTCTYALSAGGQAFSAAGGTGSTGITTPQGCTWSASDIPSWIINSTQGSGDGTLSYFVTANSGGARSATITVGGISFVIEQSASSIPGLAATGSLGQVASEGGWDFSLIGINLGASAATARFTFADNNGNPLTTPLTFPQLPPAGGPLLAATLDRTLNSNAQIAMESAGPDSAPTLVGSGQLLSNGNVSGFGIFSFPRLHWNAVVPLETRNASKYILAFDNTSSLTTGVAVASLAAQATNVPVIIRDDTGAQIGNPTIPLSALGHTSFMLNDPPPGFPVTTGMRGTIEFDTPPGGQISALGLRANGLAALTTLPVLANVGTTGGSIAHVAYNDGWTSVFYLVNTGNASAQFTLNFFDENGLALPVPLLLPQSGTTTTTSALTRTLAAGEMLAVETQAQDALTVAVGSAQLTTTGNIGGFEIFRWTTFGQEASVPLETRAPNSFVLVFDDTNGLTTGVALANLNSGPANITTRIYDDAGALLQTAPINLGGQAHTSFMLNDPTLGFPVTNNKRGMVEFVVPQGGKISAIGLRAKNDGTLTTIPVLTK